MSKKKISKHDKAVLEAGKILPSKGYNVRADHVSKQEREKNGFKPALKLVAPPLLLSAFVPTKAIFSRKCALNPNWKKPDLAVTRDGFTYVLDVIGTNSPITMAARKFETVIANITNYEKHKIVGMAFIDISNNSENGKTDNDKKKKNNDLQEKFERLRKTFNLLFEKSSHGEYPKWFWDVKSLFSSKSCQGIYGKIRWNKVLVITYGKGNWKKTLCRHVEDTLNAKRKSLLAKKQT